MENIEIKTADELWIEIERLSLDDPLIYHGLAQAKIGNFTKEYTAMAMVIVLHDALKKIREAYIAHVNNLIP